MRDKIFYMVFFSIFSVGIWAEESQWLKLKSLEIKDEKSAYLEVYSENMTALPGCYNNSFLVIYGQEATDSPKQLFEMIRSSSELKVKYLIMPEFAGKEVCEMVEIQIDGGV